MDQMDPCTTRPVWPDAAVSLLTFASAESETLPTLPDGSTPERVALTTTGGQPISFTMSPDGAVAMADADEGMVVSRGSEPLVIGVRGMDTINTFGTGANVLHIVPLEN